MKSKTQPLTTASGNYLEQALMKGLSKEGRDWVKNELKAFREKGFDDETIHYGLIRKMALDKFKKDAL